MGEGSPGLPVGSRPLERLSAEEISFISEDG
jgi:hypothetical protein